MELLRETWQTKAQLNRWSEQLKLMKIEFEKITPPYSYSVSAADVKEIANLDPLGVNFDIWTFAGTVTLCHVNLAYISQARCTTLFFVAMLAPLSSSTIKGDINSSTS